MNAKRELPPKESTIFKNILKNFELRQYKKGLKLSETILKKFPEHGETLAMKGLFLNNLGKKEEGYEYVKKGLRYDLTSHICWHVYGMLHRADNNYEEAAKCYINALKYNKNDIHIMRDLAVIQTHMRNYDASIETRTQLLQHNPTNPPFWIGLAINYQLAGRPDSALSVLKAHEESLKDMPSGYETSELLMYHNSLLEELGNYAEALAHLDSIESKVTDKRSLKEKRAEYNERLGKKDEAEVVYRILISENPHDKTYVEKLVNLRDPSVLAELQAEYPRSKAIEDLVLSHATGESFKNKVDVVLQDALRKGIPSLFNSMKKYYKDSEKCATIEKLVAEYRSCLEDKGSFTAEGDKEPPTALLWTLYYLAQQADYHKQYDIGLACVDAAIKHTPTVVELYMTKGRLLKHKGDLEEAARVMNEARELDLQDRFINSKCAKYMLRAGKIDQAEKILGLFTRKDVSTVQDLTDMQAQWFMIEEGNAYLAQKNYGMALKRFHTVEKFFADIFDDQFHFHSYCIRKMTLRAYVRALRYGDGLRDHPYFVKAAHGAVKAYVGLAEKSSTANGVEEKDMTAAEKKKAKNKARKAKKNDENVAPSEDTANKNNDSKLPVDQDPFGEKYLKTETPLDDALQFIKPLQQLAPNRFETHALGFEIYLRQSKWLLALRCISKISQFDPDNTNIPVMVERFQKAVASQESLDPTVQKVIDAQMKTLVK